MSKGWLGIGRTSLLPMYQHLLCQPQADPADPQKDSSNGPGSQVVSQTKVTQLLPRLRFRQTLSQKLDSRFISVPLDEIRKSSLWKVYHIANASHDLAMRRLQFTIAAPRCSCHNHWSLALKPDLPVPAVHQRWKRLVIAATKQK